MHSKLTAEELEERSLALRDAFPDMPNGSDILLEALIAAATIDDDEAMMLPAVESDQRE